MDSCQPDEEDTEIDAEIQKELNALNVENLEDTSSSDEDVIGEESVVSEMEVPVSAQTRCHNASQCCTRQPMCMNGVPCHHLCKSLK